MRARGRRTAIGVALATALALLLGACGDDDGDQSGGSSDSGADCPFDAEQLSDALGEDLEAVAEDATGTDGTAGTVCLFVEDGREPGPGNLTVTVTTQPDSELAVVAERFAASDPTPLPELGDDAFAAYLETSSTPESDDVIYQADLYLERDDQVLVVSLLGLPTEATRDEAVQATADLLAG